MQSFFLQKWNAFLRYLDLPGKGPTRVYLHGLGDASTSDYPRIVADPVLAGYRSLLVDFLGFGYSDRPGDFSYTLEEHTNTVTELLDHIGLTGCDVIGHSMGGSVGITLASLRPDLVRSLVVAEGNLDPGGGLFSSGIAAQSEEQFRTKGYHNLLQKVLTDKWFTFYGTLQISAPNAVYRSAVSLVKGTRPTMRERFLTLRIPRTYIFGQRSLPDPDDDRLKAQNIQVLVVPNAGHDMMLDNPAGFAQVLKVALAT